MWKHALRAWAFMVLPGFAVAAPPTVATATIVDGDAILLRDGSTFGLAEGVELRQGDIVHAGAKGRFVRLEFPDGVVLDLAPQARVLLGAKVDKAQARAYLLNGAAKLGVTAGKAPAEPLLTSPTLTLSDVARGVVLSTAPDETAVFAESGSATVVERRDFKPQPPLALRNGQFYARAGDAKASVVPRPTPAFIQALPKPFLDTLPPRLASLKARDVEPRLLGELTYAEAQPWIDAEPALRSSFVARWRPLAKRPEFRAGLVEHLPAHPEWDRVLFPEKYRPKPAPADTGDR